VNEPGPVGGVPSPGAPPQARELSVLRRPLALGVALALLVVIWSLAGLDYRAQARTHRQEFESLGRTVAAAARGSVQWLFRGGRYDPEELSASVEDLRFALGLEQLALEGADAPFAPVSAPKPAVDVVWIEEALVIPQPRSGGRHGPGPPGLRDAPTGPLVLRIALSRAPLDRRLDADLHRFLGLALALTVVLALALLALAARERSLRLALELGRTHEQLRGLEFLGRLGAGLAHETRNPLGLVRGFAQQLAGGDVPATRAREFGATIVDEVDRTVARLDEFLLLSRPARLRRERFSLHELLAELARLLEPDLSQSAARLELRPFELELDADREQCRRLFMNLLLNAAQHVAPGGRIRVEHGRGPAGSFVRIEDDGPGVPPELRETLFEPYVSGRAGGTGLGLAIARRIATEHGWKLELDPRVTRGAAFVLEIPQP